MEDTVETKEIRGLNMKIMLTIIGFVITSTVAIIMTINSLRTDLLKIQGLQEKTSELNDLKLRTLDIRVTNIENDIRSLEKEVENNREVIKKNSGG